MVLTLSYFNFNSSLKQVWTKYFSYKQIWGRDRNHSRLELLFLDLKIIRSFNFRANNIYQVYI